MRRSIVILGIALALSAPVVAQAAPPEKFTFEGETATAEWVVEDGEQVTFAGVFVNKGTFTFGGDEFEDVFIDFFAFSFGPDGITDVFGFDSVDPDDIEIDTTGGAFSAAAAAELDLEGQSCTFDEEDEICEDIGPFAVTIDVVWDDATGRIYPSSFSGRTLSPMGFDAFISKSHARFTTATGSISGDVPLGLTLGESDQASIARNSDMSRFRFIAG